MESSSNKFDFPIIGIENPPKLNFKSVDNKYKDETILLIDKKLTKDDKYFIDRRDEGVVLMLREHLEFYRSQILDIPQLPKLKTLLELTGPTVNQTCSDIAYALCSEYYSVNIDVLDYQMPLHEIVEYKDEIVPSLFLEEDLSLKKFNIPVEELSSIKNETGQADFITSYFSFGYENAKGGRISHICGPDISNEEKRAHILSEASKMLKTNGFLALNPFRHCGIPQSEFIEAGFLPVPSPNEHTSIYQKI